MIRSRLSKILIRANNITARSVIVSPVTYNGHMIKVHMDLTKHFEKNNVLCEPHPDGNGIDAAFWLLLIGKTDPLRNPDGTTPQRFPSALDSVFKCY